jgi:hypothetical protein
MKWLKAILPSVNFWFSEKWKPTLIIIGIVLALCALWFVPKWQVRGYHGRLDASAISKLTPQELIQLQQNLITAENNARLTIAQIIGGVGLLLGLYATFKNVKVAQDNHRVAQDNHRVALENLRVTEEGKLTERFSKAVELLGSEKLDVRLGGIYALERIARDSLKDHWTVMEILTAFVREQSVRWYKSSQQWETDFDGNYSHLHPVQPEINISVDVQAALTVIGRRKWIEEEKPHQRLDLSGAFLNGAKLIRVNLRRAILVDTNLTKARLELADLTEARLVNAKFNNAYLTETKLTGAILHNADLSNAFVTETDFRNAEFADFIDDGVILNSTYLRTSTGLTWEQISEAVINETTRLPPELEERRKAEQAKAAAQNQ